ncbi:XRE family transcriptional regulator [Lactobacillus delbrueckii]|nr:XRE family transcriptional regulator [Lactobacillus delbrueckii]
MPKITVKAARVNAGLTQAEAADKLGITRETLIRYEKEPKLIRQGVLAKMRSVYGMDRSNLFFRI